jgi:integrase
MEIKLKGINKVRSKGHVYYYHRASGTRLLSPYGTANFLAEVEAAERRLAPQPIEGEDPVDFKLRAGVKPGTLAALIAAYRQGPEFKTRKRRTREDYDKVFDWLIDNGYRDAPMAGFDSANIIRMRDKAFKQRKRRFANYVLQVFSLMFGWGRPRNYVKGVNPTVDVEKIARPKDAGRVNRAWKEAERQAIFATAAERQPQLLVALALGRYAALREGDALAFDRRYYDGHSIDLDQGKTGNAQWLPAATPLRKILDNAIEAQKGSDTPSLLLALNSRGKPWTESGFRSTFFKMIGVLEAEGKIGSGVTFHGLRHTAGAELADLGFDDETIAAFLGHASTAMAKTYTRDANRRRRVVVAMRRLERKRGDFAKPK